MTVDQTRTNLALDPCATASATGAGKWNSMWFGSGNTGTTTAVTGASDGPIPELTTYLRKAWSTTGGAPNAVGWGWTGTERLAVTEGVTYTISRWMRSSVTAAGTWRNRLTVSFYNSGGTIIGTAANGDSTAFTAATWRRDFITATAPVGAVTATIADSVYMGSGVAVGTTLDETGVLIEAASTVGTFFSGATGDADDWSYDWSGIANASTSAGSHEPPPPPPTPIDEGSMESLPRLLVEVYDKSLAYKGTVGVASDTTWTMRHFDIGTGQFTVDADLDVVADLATTGARVLVQYRYDPDDQTQLMHVMSGYVTEVDGSGPGIAPTRTFSVLDDKDLVWNQMKCWPVPGSALGSQGGSTTFYSATGPVETVIKGLVTANKAKLPASAPTITVEANAARGETISALMRFESIADKLGTALLYGHMGFRLRQSGSGLVFEAYQPATLTVPLSQDSGEVASGSWSLTRPTASRAYVRGGEDTGAVLIERVNAAVETDYGYCGHVYVEVSETTDTPTLQAKGDEALNEAARTVSLQVELAETADWRFGVAFQLGDEVPIQLSGAPILTDTVTEVEFTQSADNGLVITPRIGDHSGPNEQLAKAVARVAGYQRSQKARG